MQGHFASAGGRDLLEMAALIGASLHGRKGATRNDNARPGMHESEFTLEEVAERENSRGASVPTLTLGSP